MQDGPRRLSRCGSRCTRSTSSQPVTAGFDTVHARPRGISGPRSRAGHELTPLVRSSARSAALPAESVGAVQSRIACASTCARPAQSTPGGDRGGHISTAFPAGRPAARGRGDRRLARPLEPGPADSREGSRVIVVADADFLARRDAYELVGARRTVPSPARATTTSPSREQPRPLARPPRPAAGAGQGTDGAAVHAPPRSAPRGRGELPPGGAGHQRAPGADRGAARRSQPAGRAGRGLSGSASARSPPSAVRRRSRAACAGGARRSSRSSRRRSCGCSGASPR